MIKKEGSFEVHEERAGIQELIGSVDDLPEGKYKFVIYDDKKNRSLPQLKYLFGVVLKTISDQLSSHPPVDALYRYFEEVYAPLHTCEIQGEKYEYLDLKNEKSTEMSNVIDDIIHHAAQEWGIAVPDRDSLRDAEATEAYIGAYTEMWRNLPTKQ